MLAHIIGNDFRVWINMHYLPKPIDDIKCNTANWINQLAQSSS